MEHLQSSSKHVVWYTNQCAYLMVFLIMESRALISSIFVKLGRLAPRVWQNLSASSQERCRLNLSLWNTWEFKQNPMKKQAWLKEGRRNNHLCDKTQKHRHSTQAMTSENHSGLLMGSNMHKPCSSISFWMWTSIPRDSLRLSWVLVLELRLEWGLFYRWSQP